MVTTLHNLKFGLLLRNTKIAIKHLHHSKLYKSSKEIAEEILESNSVPEYDQSATLPEDTQNAAKSAVRDFPEKPTTCCMSGCANCVWIDYAEKLTEYFKDGGAKAKQDIEKSVDDPNIKAFIMHQLRINEQMKNQNT